MQVAREASAAQRPHCQRFSSGRETLTGTDMNLSSRFSKRQSSALLSLDVVQTSRQKLVMCLRINGKHGSNVPPVNVTLRDVGRSMGWSERWAASGASSGALAGGNGTSMASGKVSDFSVTP